MNRDWLPTVAGVLEIVAAVCALIGGGALVFAALMIEAVPDIQNDPDVPVDLITGLLVAIAFFVFLAGVVALAGGVCGIRRRGWGWTLAGSIAAMFLMPPAGIIALLLAILGEREFEERKSRQQGGG